ncbi:MAG: hypothetical protein K0S47_779 [Herbinix sp.]|jgi:flagellar biosynthesis/type III secretory pathway chaperone|nr:hypothetical protein [Herbinix sp.]
MDQRNQHGTYLALLADTLQKKSHLLDKLTILTDEQESIISAGRVEDDRFQEIMDEKEKHILSLQQLDDGFELIYNRVKEELSGNAAIYKEIIRNLQELITKVTDKSVSLQASEMRNKSKMEAYMMTKRKEIRNVKMSNQTVANYYNNMASKGQSYFYDKKK